MPDDVVNVILGSATVIITALLVIAVVSALDSTAAIDQGSQFYSAWESMKNGLAIAIQLAPYGMLAAMAVIIAKLKNGI